MFEAIRSLIRQEVELVMASARKHPRNAIITSLDTDTYSARVQFQPHDPTDPDGSESGWLPIQSVATGRGHGIFALPAVGDPVEVSFTMGDHESGCIVQRHVSEAHQPPQNMREGEFHLVHGNGAVLKFLADGTVVLAGAGTVPNRAGKDASTGKDGKTTTRQPQALQSLTMKPDGSWAVAHKSGGQIAMDASGNVTVSSNGKNVTVDAGAGAVTYKGGSHSFKGSLHVSGGITASQTITGLTGS